MSGRFPGAPDVAAFWSNLRNGVESIAWFSDDELARSGIAPALLANPSYVKAGGMIEGMGLFISFLFQTFPYERLLLDMPAFNVPLVEACTPLVSHEGAISDYFSYGGRTWDRCFLSIRRTAWEPAAVAFFDDAPSALTSTRDPAGAGAAPR